MISRMKPFLLVLALAFSCWGTIAAQDSKQVAAHVVEKGETLYHISKQYGVTVAELLRVNPSVQNHTVKAGQTLVIPIVPSAANENKRPKTVEYKVKRKETVWGIAHAHGVSVEELVQVNPEMEAPEFKLKKGMVIRIPVKTGGTAQAAPDKASGKSVAVPQRAVAVDEMANRGTEFKPTNRVVKVAVLLPLVGNSGVKERCLEYYRGFLLAVDSMKRMGQSVEVYTFDTPPGKSLASVLTRVKAVGAQAIVGPFYGDHITQVAAFAAQNKTLAYIPFSSRAMDVYSNPYVCLLNAPEAEKHKAILSMFKKIFPKETPVTLVYTPDGNEKTFFNFMQSQLTAAGYSIKTVSDAATAGQLQSVLKKKKRNVIMTDASDLQTLDKLMPTLTAIAQSQPEYPLTLFGYPDWQAYVNNHVKNFHTLDAYLYTNFYYDAHKPDVKHFERVYRDWFHKGLLPIYPRMALQGFDSGIYLLRGLALYGNGFSVQRLVASPYQSGIHIERVGKDAGFINNFMEFVHFRTDGAIDKITVK